MKKTLSGTKIAVLVANGFLEKDMTLTQQALLPMGANMKIVSMDQGLVNSWNNLGWGLNFASDQILSEALAADFDMLIVPGGQKSIDKLKMTAHTKRFVGGFVDAGKPVAFFEDAVELLSFSGRASGFEVTGAESVRSVVEASGALWCDDLSVISRNVISGRSGDKGDESYSRKVVEFFVAESLKGGGEIAQAA